VDDGCSSSVNLAQVEGAIIRFGRSNSKAGETPVDDVVLVRRVLHHHHVHLPRAAASRDVLSQPRGRSVDGVGKLVGILVGELACSRHAFRLRSGDLVQGRESHQRLHQLVGALVVDHDVVAADVVGIWRQHARLCHHLPQRRRLIEEIPCRLAPAQPASDQTDGSWDHQRCSLVVQRTPAGGPGGSRRICCGIGDVGLDTVAASVHGNSCEYASQALLASLLLLLLFFHRSLFVRGFL